MERGKFWVYRKIISSKVFKNEGLLKVWIWCLAKASYKERWILVKTGKSHVEVKLEPGQFIFGRFSSVEELDMYPSTIRNRMEKLKNMGNLNIKSDSQYSIISVINWDTYQNEFSKEDSEEDSQRTQTIK